MSAISYDCSMDCSAKIALHRFHSSRSRVAELPDNHPTKEQTKEQIAADLAINGGPKAVTCPLPCWPPQLPSIGESISASVADGSWGQYHGEPIEKFRVAMGNSVGKKFVWPCSSGTIAVELALRGLGVTQQHEVILAGYDFPGNFRAVEAIAARPVLIDIGEDGYVIDPANIESAITEKTKAIVVSHLHGHLAEIGAICEICAAAGVKVLEDACQVPGATVQGQPAGSIGDVGVFSFGGSKLLTAGRGGAVVTDDEEVMQRIRISAERGNDAYPFSSLQAAALTPQLAVLDALNRRRLSAARQLQNQLADNHSLLPLSLPENDAWLPAFYKFPIRVANSLARQPIIDALAAEGVPAAAGFRGFTKRSARRCDKHGKLQNSQRAAEQTILLHHPCLLSEDEQLIQQIAVAIKKVENHLAS